MKSLAVSRRISMSQQTLRPKAAALEKLFAAPASGTFLESLKRDASRQLADEGLVASNYELYAVRSNVQSGSEIFGPHKLHLGAYDEDALYGKHTSPAFRFRDAVKRLAAHAQRCTNLSEDPLEFAHQVVLLWSEIGQLKDFLGVADEIDELVAALRTARFQFLRNDTPSNVVVALAEALGWIVQTPVLDVTFVDRVGDRLEAAGIDTFAQDADIGANG